MVTFGDAGERQLRLGNDLRYLSQQINESFTLRSSQSGLAPFQTNLPTSWMVNPGLFNEVVLPNGDWTTTIGGPRLGEYRIREKIVPGTAFSPTPTPLSNGSRNDVLYAFFMQNKLRHPKAWSFDTGFGQAQHAPTLTHATPTACSWPSPARPDHSRHRRSEPGQRASLANRCGPDRQLRFIPQPIRGYRVVHSSITSRSGQFHSISAEQSLERQICRNTPIPTWRPSARDLTSMPNTMSTSGSRRSRLHGLCVRPRSIDQSAAAANLSLRFAGGHPHPRHRKRKTLVVEYWHPHGRPANAGGQYSDRARG